MYPMEIRNDHRLIVKSTKYRWFMTDSYVAAARLQGHRTPRTRRYASTAGASLPSARSTWMDVTA